jgi:predicted lipid-binding transport protein (Tim44 family)
MKAVFASLVAAATVMALAIPEADAARMGGGRSIGAQRSITTAPSSAPARQQQAAPSQTQQAAPARQAGTPAAQPAPASGLSRWMPMLGGLALGGLLGALIGSSGLGTMLLTWLALAALAFGVVFLVRTVLAKRTDGAAPMPYAAGGAQPASYAALGDETVAAPPPSQASGFERQPLAVQSAHIPAGFDTAGFLRAAKLNFMKLQIANDSGNMDELREFTTPDLYEELRRDVAQRGSARQQTDVLSLNADLLEVTTEPHQHWASVRFSGMIRESQGSAPESFEEIWNLAKPRDGSSGWLLAGIQQTH